MERPIVNPEHLGKLSGRLRTQLQALQLEPRAEKWVKSWQEWKPDWRWGLIGSAVVAALILYFLIIPRGPSLNAEDLLFLSQENVISELLADLGEDPQLLGTFNQAVLAAIDRTLSEVYPGGGFHMVESPLFLDDLSQEELEYLESEIKKQMKS